MKKIRNEEVKKVLPSSAFFYCRGSALISRKIRFLCLLENLNLVGVGSLRPVVASGVLL